MKKNITFPKNLKREDHFITPIWLADEPGFVKQLNKASDPYIEAAKKREKKVIDERNKKFGNKGDMGHVFHSTSLIGNPKFESLQNYVVATAHNLLDEMGFNLKNYQIFLTELWVQEFSKKGGGHHTLHTHWNGHISGFYFLKSSDKTSMPLFEDPRPGNVMNLLPEKDRSQLDYSSSQVNFVCNPGRMMFFPSYLPHQFTVDIGYEPFRFIHWNCQAILKSAVNYYKDNNVIQKK
jgi:uncharacterized protein (TIGR02466 family)